MADNPLEPFEIPAETVERWQSLPADEPITIILTKAELDFLFMGLRRVAAASLFSSQKLMRLLQTIQHNDDKDMLEIVNTLTISYNNFNAFIAIFMDKVTGGQYGTDNEK